MCVCVCGGGGGGGCGLSNRLLLKINALKSNHNVSKVHF